MANEEHLLETSCCHRLLHGMSAAGGSVDDGDGGQGKRSAVRLVVKRLVMTWATRTKKVKNKMIVLVMKLLVAVATPMSDFGSKEGIHHTHCRS